MKKQSFFEDLENDDLDININDEDLENNNLDNDIDGDDDIANPDIDFHDDSVSDTESLPEEPITENVEESCDNCLENNDIQEIMDIITTLGSKLAEKGLIKNFNISWELGENELAENPAEPIPEAIPAETASADEVFDDTIPEIGDLPAEVNPVDEEDFEEIPNEKDFGESEYTSWFVKGVSVDDVESIKIYCQIYDLPEPVIIDNDNKTFNVLVKNITKEQSELLDSKLA